jgi:hypothetical protein
MDLNGFCGTTILSLERLKEVALHDRVSNETKHKWKEAAKNHPKRPKLLFVKTKLMGSEPVVETPAAPVTCTALSVKLDAICTGQRECPGKCHAPFFLIATLAMCTPSSPMHVTF